MVTKFLVPSLLAPLTINEFLVHDLFSFAEEVSSFCPDHFMASLNVESLFTTIPLNEVTGICIDDLLFDTNPIHNLDCNDIREQLTLAAYELFFIFDGIAMGSQLGPILVNARLCHFEKQWLSECAPEFYPNVLKDMLIIFL